MQFKISNLTLKIINMKHLALTFLFIGIVIGCFAKDKEKNSTREPGNTSETNKTNNEVAFWLTTSDQKILFKKQNANLVFTPAINQNLTIEIDTTKTFQTIDGFGYALTDGSAMLINALSTPVKDALLKELFLSDSTNIGVSYLRISIGASDLNPFPFTYNDLPTGQTDINLDHFSLSPDKADLIPILQKIIALSPKIKILGSPWSPPTWMKTNDNFIGGSLKPEYYAAYANYFVKYISAMKSEGIRLDAVTIQNEPHHPKNNPSMLMLAPDQANFIKNNLGPAFQKANINTKIQIWDHNCDVPEYPLTILADAEAAKYVDGSAFHMYAGDISALSKVHDAHPDKNVYFTEQWIGSPSNFGADLDWHVKTLIIGATRNWSKNVLERNLAADPNNNPHTDKGGCDRCLGAITVTPQGFSKNAGYYIIAHASKFVRPGSVRIDSNIPGKLDNVAFQTPEGNKVLIVVNSDVTTQTFNIKFKGKTVTSTLDAGAVGTYVW